MPLFHGTVSSSGLPKPLNMSNYLGKQTLPYNGAYYAYDPQGKEGAQFTSPWSESKTSLLDGRPGVSHHSGMETERNAFYRQDGNSSTEDHSNRSLAPHASVKQGFKLYTKSPGICSSAAATLMAVRNPKTGSETSSPLSENQSYLAIPKPVYAHNPCCDDVGFVRGQYSMEAGLPGIPTSVRKPHWLQTDLRFKENPAFQKTTGDTVLQRGALHFVQPSAGRLQKVPVEYSPGGAAPYTAVIEPNYKGYPSTLFRTHFGPLSEQSEQTFPGSYPYLYPSHYTYEHKTSDVYQEHSHMAKYGHLTQRPMFYCTQPDVEADKRTPRKDNCSQTREDVPLILKHAVQGPQEHYGSPHLRRVDVPFPFACTETPPNPALLQGLGLHHYAIPRFHSNVIQCTAPLQKQDTPSDRAKDSSLGFCVDYSKFSVTNIHHGSTPHADAARPSTADLAIPTQRTSEPDVSKKTQNNRPCAPHGLLNVGRYKDSSCEGNVSPGPRQTYLLHDRSDETNSVIQKGLSVRKIICSPPVSPERKRNVKLPLTSLGLKVAPKRRSSCSFSPIEIKKEREELLDEVEFPKKPTKVEAKLAKGRHTSRSPPMPVISDVFSLAPYKAQLQAYEGSIAGPVPPKPIKSDHCESQGQRGSSKKVISEDKEQLVCQEKPVDGIMEAKNIKVEKHLSNKDMCEEKSVCQEDYSNVAVNKESEESSSSGCGHVPGFNRGGSGTLEKQSAFADQRQTPVVPIPVEVRPQVAPPPVKKTSASHKGVAKPSPTSPPPPSNTKADFKNIPPHCLKLTTFTILLPDANLSSSARPPENASTKPTAKNIAKPSPQMPVRKHFFELHHSLYKLINKSVFASSEEALRTWLSQLDLAETASPHAKIKRMSCLLGVKARLLWFNEEIKSALQDLLQRLNEYIVQDRCPFPHVIRAGAVFLPMLVMKEQLFPMVHSNYIDQVLQEHKIELRPATLSEEKILIQLHKRACSSRLRKLMSLKHLPDIYADVANVLYYCCVTKCLGLDADKADCGVKEEACEEVINAVTVVDDVIASPASPADSQSPGRATDHKAMRNRTKSRIKSSSRRTFLDDGLSDEEKGEAVRLNDGFYQNAKRGCESEGTERKGDDCTEAEQIPSHLPPVTTSDNSWMCPLTFEDLPPSPADPDAQGAKPTIRSAKCTGVILKLRRLFGCNRKKVRYQAVPDCNTPDTDASEAGQGVCKWRRVGGFLNATTRPAACGSSKRKRLSFLKVKHCPYLSAHRSASEHRRHLALQQAVRRPEAAGRLRYPDLVGKTIRHLYEEDDKSEVWYRGKVLRVHEAHSNPLKTIFEVRYDSEPEWRYFLELLIDYKKGWLKVDE